MALVPQVIPADPAEALLEELRSAGRPLSLPALRQGAAARGVPANLIRKTLDELVGARRVFVWSGKRWALEPESAFLRQHVLGALASDRLRQRELVGRLASTGINARQLKSAIASLVEEGAIHSVGRGAGQLLSASPLPSLEQTLLTLAGEQPLSKKDLAKLTVEELPWHTASEVGRAIQALRGAGALLEHKAAKMLYAIPPDQESFVRRAAERSYRDTIESWRTVLGGKTAGAPQDVGALVLDAVLRVEPQKGMLVTMRQLRESSWLRHLGKSDFDRAVLDLARARKLFLTQHSAPFHLSESEREFLVRDERGTYYGGVSWRD